MSMYADYIKERLGDQCIETETGFATYRYMDKDTVYIMDIYVKPDFRRRHECSDIADKVVEAAKMRGCNKLMGSVVPSSKGSTVSLRVLLDYGMKLESAATDFIIFMKDI